MLLQREFTVVLVGFGFFWFWVFFVGMGFFCLVGLVFRGLSLGFLSVW